jgi:hypothetical protein
MRAAWLLSLMIVICGVAAARGIPAVYVAGRPVFGLSGLLIALAGAALPPLAVIGFKKLRAK